MNKKQSYSSLLSEEKKFTIALSKIKREKNEMIKAYKNCSSEEEKFLCILMHLKTTTYQGMLEDLIYLDANLSFSEAKIFIDTNSQKLLDSSQIGSIKTNNQYGFYIINR